MQISTRLLSLALSATIILLCFSSTGCQQRAEETLTVSEARVLLERYVGTMSDVDMAVIDEIIDPEFVLRSPMFPEPIVGLEGYKAMAMNTAGTFTDFKATIGEVFVVGDEAFGRFTLSGTNTGPLGPLPATGKSFRVEAFAVTRIVDGKIVADETFWNVLDLYQQLGFTLVPPETP